MTDRSHSLVVDPQVIPLVRRPRLLRRRRPLAVLLGILGVLLVPTLAAAHPLGNFTINHYTGIRVEPDRILLDVVIDQAEIPTFQARLDFDTDGDGEVSDEETDAGRVTACDGLEPSLALNVAGVASNLTLTEAGLTFPAGVGGLSTMRMVCGFRADTGRNGTRHRASGSALHLAAPDRGRLRRQVRSIERLQHFRRGSWFLRT